MTRKKNKQRKEAPHGGNGSPSGGGIVAPLGPALDGAGPASKKDVVTPALPQPPASPALIICRNKSVVPSRCLPSQFQVTSHRARGIRDNQQSYLPLLPLTPRHSRCARPNC